MDNPLQLATNKWALFYILKLYFSGKKTSNTDTFCFSWGLFQGAGLYGGVVSSCHCK